jgi:MoaA/NifB/PqqE/SkfB family radical SAM enzyme
MQDECVRLSVGTASRYGLGTADRVDEVPRADGLLLRRSVGHLAKVYVEVTGECNLLCRTCVRNAWDERPGTMPIDLFGSLVDQLKAFPGPLTVMFSGYGEPLIHPELPAMIRLAHDIGARVELVTNATLLGPDMRRTFVELQVDRVWVSVDSVGPESFAAIRQGARLDAVLANVRELYRTRLRGGKDLPEIGLVFVAMKRNVADLARLYRLASSLHASEVLVSNILAHTQEMVGEILYRRSLTMGRYSLSKKVPRLHLPRIDVNEVTAAPLVSALHDAQDVSLGGGDYSDRTNYCPFVNAGAVAIRWDGAVSPCPPLLHSHPVWVAERWKRLRHASFGNIAEQPLADIWHSAAYTDFRRRVRAFEFSPCVYCGGCERSAGNESDCSGNSFPVCGGCLWAQGVVYCP